MLKLLVIKSYRKLPSPVQYLHPYNPSLCSDIKTFGSVDNYDNVLKSCGLWDFTNDRMLPARYSIEYLLENYHL